ncbi:MAG: ferrochelatase [Desulfocapsaceae bacterium]|nr:ferrochelatase [Desulfocapsaceae bacterium]
MTKSTTTGVVLLNMGGPEKPEDVAPFLYNLFSDRDIIRLGPKFLQKPLAWYIARKRAPKSLETYKKIGGGSPLIKITQDQAQALSSELSEYGSYKVLSAMRYWHPTAEQALEKLSAAGITEVIALPLYPHYCCATTGSSLADLQRAAYRSRDSFDITEIKGWPDNPKYIECFAKNILEGIAEFSTEDITVVYSAHSLPVSFITEGDPYCDHLNITIEKIEEITGIKGRLCYQSRSGPVEWLSPSTPEMLESLAAEGCKNVLMVPISFVSDHVETLYEIDMLYREMASKMGMRCLSCKSLNTDPLFIESLRDLVLQHRAH